MSFKNSEKTIVKYLNNYAEPEVQHLDNFPALSFRHVVVVPVYKESADFLIRLQNQFSQKDNTSNILLIMVINQPKSDEDERPQRALNNGLQQTVARNGQLDWHHQNLSLFSCDDSNISVLTVNRFTVSLRIPDKQGVGLARKIGSDLAVWLIHYNRVKHSQIFSTDADAQLPEDYFSASQLAQGSSAGVFDFKHMPSGDIAIDKATSLYERRLHYYVQGLKYAGSGYGFHTIGSCIVVDMLAYCQVRGFPKKSGGEDFYLLNKLAKLGKVQSLAPIIQIKSRSSDRVPFGTGPAVSDIVTKKQNEDSYLVYHPQIFDRLRLTLQNLAKLARTEIDIESFLTAIDQSSREYFEEAGFALQFNKWHKQYPNQQKLQIAINEWFDAFRTLKYVHFQRDIGLGDVSLKFAENVRNF